MNQVVNDNIRKAVRKQYGLVAQSGASGCCGSDASCCGGASSDAKDISMQLGYSSENVNQVPEGANMGLGCGNPQSIASLKPGETVLDLGSGGGFDCFLAADEVGSEGQVIGVDMTPEMVSKSRKNVEKAGHKNVDFRLGEIENLPVSNSSVDVIISNCVINLSPDKARVFRESFRVRKSGGRLAISDTVATASIPEEWKQDMNLLTGCMSGASQIEDLERRLEQAGFSRIAIYPKDESRDFLRDWVPNTRLEDYVTSATIEAVKP